MNSESIESMLKRDHEEWERLSFVLDARPTGPLHEKGQPEWTSRDVYAHLARWMDLSTDGIEAWLAGRMPPVEEGTDDAVNLRFQQRDSSLTFDEARRKAQTAFRRRIEAIISIPIDRWDQVLDELAAADGWRHYEAHREGVVP